MAGGWGGGVGQSEIAREWANRVSKVGVEDQAWCTGLISVSKSEWKRVRLQCWGDGPLSLCPACLLHAPDA